METEIKKKRLILCDVLNLNKLQQLLMLPLLDIPIIKLVSATSFGEHVGPSHMSLLL